MIRSFRMNLGRSFGLLALVASITSCATADKGPSAALSPAAEVPEIQREFRAGWVATVSNIDWPSRKDLSTEQQKAEALAILDKAKELNFNALVFQIRPHCDALYKSDLEPWSEYLTGTQGKAPSPHYDPLELWVTEAHKRGIQLHAWFNPYRANHPGAKTMADSHIAKKRPDLVRKLGDKGYLWLDPAEPEVQKLSLDVVLDVTKRYDVDGIHFDDYFYPYDSYNDGKDFPDDVSWAKYQAAGGKLARNDWRRKAVDDYVKSIHEGVHKVRKTVMFGMSPFGIWRPQNPPGVKGMDQYDKLYADAKLWLNEGWVDYYTPQLYWPIKGDQSYTALLDWWISENTKNVHIWPGNGTYRVSEKADSKYPKQEIIDQINETRKRAPKASGNVHFSWKVFQNNSNGLADTFKNDLYKEPALIPASPWLDDAAPAAPKLGKITKAANGTRIEFAKGSDEVPFLFTVQYRTADGAWHTQLVNGETKSVDLTGTIDTVAVAAVDRTGNSSTKSVSAVGN